MVNYIENGSQKICISVVIPTYNSAECITRAIDSVLAQTDLAHEIIVVDDGSTDHTDQKVRVYGSKVRFEKLESNLGPSVARNKGIEIATGNWIAFLDADDKWLPEKLAHQKRVISENPELRWCCTNYYLDDHKKRVVCAKIARVKKALAGGNKINNYFIAAVKKQCQIVTTAIMIRRDIFDELGYFDPSLIRHQDWDLCWRIAHRYPVIGYVAEPLTVGYLDIENPVSAQRRAKAKRGEGLRKIISRHLQFAQDAGSLDNFKPFALMRLSHSVLMMLFLGYKKDARTTIEQFKMIFPWYWRIAVYVLTIFSRLTANLIRAVVFCTENFGLENQVSRKWTFLKKSKERL